MSRTHTLLRGQSSHRVVKGQWNRGNVEHTSIDVSGVFHFRAVDGISTPENFLHIRISFVQFIGSSSVLPVSPGSTVG